MRYYDFTLKTNAEKIKANTKVRLQDYCYDSPVAAVNVLVQKNTFTDMAFFIYTVEGETAYASFAFDEQKYTYQYVFGTICDLLSANFCIELGKSDPEEITMSQYLDNFLEGKRHDYFQGYSHIVDSSHLWLYYYRDEDERKLNFDMEESIAPLNLGNLDIYDDSFRNELSNINVHKLETDTSPFRDRLRYGCLMLMLLTVIEADCVNFLEFLFCPEQASGGVLSSAQNNKSLVVRFC